MAGKKLYQRVTGLRRLRTTDLKVISPGWLDLDHHSKDSFIHFKGGQHGFPNKASPEEVHMLRIKVEGKANVSRVEKGQRSETPKKRMPLQH